MNLRFEQPFQQNPDVSATAPTTARDPISNRWTLKEGLGTPIFFADRIAVTPEVAAGGVVDAEIDMVNAALTLSPFEPDKCSEGGVNGFSHTVTVDPSWATAQSRSDCLTMNENRKTQAFDFDAPSTGGVYSVEVSVEMDGSGNSASETFEVSVVEPTNGGNDGVEQRPGAGDDRGGGTGDGLLPEVGSATAGLVLVVVVLFLLLAIGLAAP